MSQLFKNFHYHEPRNLSEVCALLKEHRDEARLLAGGTDLIVQMKKGRVTNARHLINLKRLKELKSIEPLSDGGLRIGALVTLEELLNSPYVRDRFPVIVATSTDMGSPPIRNLATIGGNLCNASPAADLAPPLIVLDATLTLASDGGSREVPVEKFFLGPGRNCLGGGELLTHITIPATAGAKNALYIKHAFRRGSAIAAVGVAARVAMDSGRCTEARIALGAVAPTPIRVPGAEMLLRQDSLSDATAGAASDEARRASRPITDMRSTAEYRRAMVQVLTKRAILRASSGTGPLPFRSYPLPQMREPDPLDQWAIGDAQRITISLRVNGEQVETAVRPRTTLLSLLRDELELTGTKEGCSVGDCSACAVLMDGRPVTSCLVLAADARGREVTTIEGLAKEGQLHPIQRAFLDLGAVQCGYCIPGMIISAKGLLDLNPDPTESEVRTAIQGNICRCTGYVKIVEAILAAAPNKEGQCHSHI